MNDKNISLTIKNMVSTQKEMVLYQVMGAVGKHMSKEVEDYIKQCIQDEKNTQNKINKILAKTYGK